jgi:hypothetical protein
MTAGTAVASSGYNLPEITFKSEIIATVVVTDVEKGRFAFQDDKRAFPFTQKVQLKIENVISGNPDNSIGVFGGGGTVGGDVAYSWGAFSETGSRCLVFLKKRGDRYIPTSQYSVFELKENKILKWPFENLNYRAFSIDVVPESPLPKAFSKIKHFLNSWVVSESGVEIILIPSRSIFKTMRTPDFQVWFRGYQPMSSESV